jgi:hypothetical protein
VVPVSTLVLVSGLEWAHPPVQVNGCVGCVYGVSALEWLHPPGPVNGCGECVCVVPVSTLVLVSVSTLVLVLVSVSALEWLHPPGPVNGCGECVCVVPVSTLVLVSVSALEWLHPPDPASVDDGCAVCGYGGRVYAGRVCGGCVHAFVPTAGHPPGPVCGNGSVLRKST